MGISLCMIVKNEEDWVLGAVESVRSIVDEVIIVDTGSTDATATRASALLDADERLAPRDLPYIKDATRGDADGYHLIQLKRATRLGLDSLHVHLELGNVHLAVGQLEAARSEYARCLEMDSNNPIVLYNYGLALRKMGDSAGATQSYERAVRIEPRFQEPTMELAVLYLQAGRADEALAVLGNLQRIDGAALSLAGAAYLQKDNIEEAQKSLEAALRKDRTLIDARMNLAQIHTRKGDHARAARYLLSVTAQ